LIDASGTIGQASNQDLFREYLNATRQLLLTEPQKTRVWVSMVTSESFGSGRPLLGGRTPESKGIFTGELDQARHQLASAFVAKAGKVRPISAGTDIFGGLWQMKMLIDSVPASQKEIWIFSDMINESLSFNMPVLVGLGPEKMMEQAKLVHLVVPLPGHRIHVVGASAAGLTPEKWYSVKSFWREYFREAGAELVSYSPECSSPAR
jgi:hypothetical protein